MAQLISFGNFEHEPDTRGMDEATLRAYLAWVRAEIAQLDEREPKNMASEAYEEWGDRHEELEDLEDEILDELDGV